jgi:hypothetical protein
MAEHRFRVGDRVFIELQSPGGQRSSAEQDFLIEVLTEDGRAVLTVPGRWMGPAPDRVR